MSLEITLTQLDADSSQWPHLLEPYKWFCLGSLIMSWPLEKKERWSESLADFKQWSLWQNDVKKETKEIPWWLVKYSSMTGKNTINATSASFGGPKYQIWSAWVTPHTTGQVSWTSLLSTVFSPLGNINWL